MPLLHRASINANILYNNGIHVYTTKVLFTRGIAAFISYKGALLSKGPSTLL